MRLYSSETLKLFEFDKILTRIEQFCRTKASKQKVKFIKPFEDRENTIKLLNQVNEYKNILDNKGYFPDFLFEDFEYESGLLSLPGSVLLEKQLLKILHASNLVNTLIKYF